MNKFMLSRISTSLRLLFMLALTLMVTTAVEAQCPQTELTSGLLSPSKIVQSPLGNLLVAEFGTATPNTARISLVDKSGNRRTLLGGLPSGTNAIGDNVGTTGLYLNGRTLYITTGEGDSTTPAFFPMTMIPIPGAEAANPTPSSPIFSAVLALHFSANVEKTTSGFTLTAADQQALKNGAQLTLTDASGNRATLELIADFPDYAPEFHPLFANNVRHSNPYGVTKIEDQLYVVDAGFNSVRKVSIPTGAHTTLATFPPLANPLFPSFGGPVIEAVPTSIRASGGQLLVTIFRGFPFLPGTAEVRTVDPVSGSHAALITGLTSAMDVLPLGGTQYLTLELSTDLLAGQPGRLQRWPSPAGPATPLSTCLIGPSSMVLDAKTGTLYITEIFTGRVVQLPL